MGDINYAPLIKDMVWSYSRLKSFDDCKYRWYLRYIRKLKSKDMFFASYGTFMHELIEQFYRGQITPTQMRDTYLQEFKNRVVGRAPNQKIFARYFKDGLKYLNEFKPFPYSLVGVEQKVEFDINGHKMVGYIDYLGTDGNNLYVIDNKSRLLKPRSKREKPTKTDQELDSYLKQLYLYSTAVEQEYGVKPKKLCFNCFRDSLFIEEPFLEKAYEEANTWAANKIDEITAESDFEPNMDYFKCEHLCEMQEHCEYYNLMKKERATAYKSGRHNKN